VLLYGNDKYAKSVDFLGKKSFPLLGKKKNLKKFFKEIKGYNFGLVSGAIV